MGGTQSLPLAQSELTQAYIRTPRLTKQFYHQHLLGKALGDQELLYQVPADILDKVSLHPSLDLSFNLIEEIPVDLPLCLPHLTVLNLSHNKISAIPQSIFGFIHLRLLDLSYNSLEDIPQTLSCLRELRKLDLSHNKISKVPSNINLLKKLDKLNVSHNNIEHLPLSLGNISSLQVLLATDNPLQLEFEEDIGSGQLLSYLRRCWEGSVVSLPSGHISLGNNWTRVRGSVFDCSVLNAGSAQSLFEQMQAQAVNTGNRLLTPLIPPSNATNLNVDKLKDSLVGMFYGAAVGDSLGMLTDQMTGDEAEFHYSRRHIDQHHLYRDEIRSEARPGQVTPASHLALTMLDSVMNWAGVVDELDYSKRLLQWYEEHRQFINSPFLHGIMENKEAFLGSPNTAARQFRDSRSCENSDRVDGMCLPPMLGLFVAQFHNMQEVQENARYDEGRGSPPLFNKCYLRRICSATHCDEEHIALAVKFAQILSKIMQGTSLQTILQEDQVEIEKYEVGSIKILMNNVELFERSGFKEAVSNVVMMGGNASINGFVVGAVFGALQGFQNLPPNWIQNIDEDFKINLDKKLNVLLDLMGVP